LVLAVEPIGSHDGENRPCLLVEINDTKHVNCREERQNGLNALFFS